MDSKHMIAILQAELACAIEKKEIPTETLTELNDSKYYTKEIEVLVCENIKLTRGAIEDVNYISDLLDCVNNIKPINKRFYECFLLSEVKNMDADVVILALEEAYGLLDETIDLEIKKELLGKLVLLLLTRRPLNIEKIEKYKNELKSLIQGD